MDTRHLANNIEKAVRNEVKHNHRLVQHNDVRYDMYGQQGGDKRERERGSLSCRAV